MVVAVWAQRFAELGVFSVMPSGADDGLTVWADIVLWSGSAGQNAAISLSAGVDRAKARCGEREEHRAVSGDGGWNALAAGQSSADELVSVSSISLGAGQAPGRAAGLASDGQDTAGFVDGAVAMDQLSGGAVDVVDPAAQQDGLNAAVRMLVGRVVLRDCRGVIRPPAGVAVGGVGAAGPAGLLAGGDVEGVVADRAEGFVCGVVAAVGGVIDCGDVEDVSDPVDLGDAFLVVVRVGTDEQIPPVRSNWDVLVGVEVVGELAQAIRDLSSGDGVGEVEAGHHSVPFRWSRLGCTDVPK